MQIFESALCGADRPCPPQGCPDCQGRQVFHRHGGYDRFADCAEQTKIFVQRFLCTFCRRTFGVIPKDKLPYRALPVSRLEAGLDALYDVPAPPALAAPATGGGARPPPVSEIEQGCLERARKSLLLRLPVLCGWMGQQWPLLDDLRGFWLALRAMRRTTGQTLRFLAEHFKSSLLGDYRSLRPPWAREKVPT